MFFDNKNLKEETAESIKGCLYQNADCDIIESDKEYKLVYDIPGADKDHIDIKVQNNVLSLVAECTQIPEDTNISKRYEMNYGGYKRSFELGNTIDAGSINADYSNGTLTLTLPKKEEEKVKEIKITVN